MPRRIIDEGRLVVRSSIKFMRKFMREFMEESQQQVLPADVATHMYMYIQVTSKVQLWFPNALVRISR